MTTEVDTHLTTTSLVQIPLAEVQGSTDLVLKVSVSCSSGCDLWGGSIKVIAQDGAMEKEAVLVSFDGTANETDEFTVKARFEPGEYSYTAVFPAQERKGILHRESSMQFSFSVRQHTTGVEVWDIPSVMAVGEEFRIRVGVTCSSQCSLAGQQIEIFDHAGVKVTTGMLGDLPLPGTTALYWVEMGLQAPLTEGRHRWSVRFPKPDLEPPHEEASHTFVLVTARRAEHMMTIGVVEKDTKAPINNARLRLRPLRYSGSAYMASTDEAGVARLNVPTGNYQLYIWSDQYEKIEPVVKVDGDLSIKAELSERLGSWRELPH